MRAVEHWPERGLFAKVPVRPVARCQAERLAPARPDPLHCLWLLMALRLATEPNTSRFACDCFRLARFLHGGSQHIAASTCIVLLVKQLLFLLELLLRQRGLGLSLLLNLAHTLCLLPTLHVFFGHRHNHVVVVFPAAGL